MYVSNTTINIKEDEPFIDEPLTKVAYSIGLELSNFRGDLCADRIPCGQEDETIGQILSRGWGHYKFSNNLMLDLPPSQSKVITLAETLQEGILSVKANLGECFLWDLRGGKDWLKGSILFYAGTIPLSLSFGNPNPFAIKLTLLVAQQTDGPLTVTKGSI